MARDTEFYERRIIEERAAAANAADPLVRERHSQLADLYAEKLKALEPVVEPSARPVLNTAFDQARA